MEKILARLKRGDYNIKGIEIYKINKADKAVYNYKKTGRTNHLLHLITSGVRSYETEDQTMSFEAGTLLLIPEGTKYKTVGGADCGGFGIIFECNKLFTEAETKIYFSSKGAYTPHLQKLLQAGYTQFKSNPLDAFITKTTIYSIFSYLIGLLEQKSEEYNLIKPAVDYISAHFKENISVQTYAEICNLSESYFRKVFSNYMGMSPIEYRNNLRFAEAKRMYQEGYRSEYIADNLGFCDASYMLKIYKRENGVSLKTEAKFV